MALSQTEKDILGYMVDIGEIKGEVRVAVGSSDTLAREKIAEFKEQQNVYLPLQIAALINKRDECQDKIDELTNLQTLLGE